MNETDNGDRPAFPNMPPMDVCGVGSAGGYPYPDAGMSKREYFAAMAMQGLLASGPHDCEAAGIAHDALLFADALLSALRKEG